MKKTVLLGAIGAAVTVSALAINYAVTRHEAAVEPVVPPHAAAPAESTTAAVQVPGSAQGGAADSAAATAPALDSGARVVAAPASDQDSTGKVYPEFDIVRVNPTGDGVIAGRGAPGAVITLLRDGQPVDSVTADDRGEWVLLPGVGVLQGAHEISLTSRVDGQGEVRSQQVVVLSKPDGSGGETLPAQLTPRDQTGGAVVQALEPSGAVPAAAEPASRPDAAVAAVAELSPPPAASAAVPPPSAAVTPPAATPEAAPASLAPAAAAPPEGSVAEAVTPAPDAATPAVTEPDSQPAESAVAATLSSAAAAPAESAVAAALSSAAAAPAEPAADGMSAAAEGAGAEGEAAQVLALSESTGEPAAAPAAPEAPVVAAVPSAPAAAPDTGAPLGPVLAPSASVGSGTPPAPSWPAPTDSSPVSIAVAPAAPSVPAPAIVPAAAPAVPEPQPATVAAADAAGSEAVPVPPPPTSARGSTDSANISAGTDAESGAKAQPAAGNPAAVDKGANDPAADVAALWTGPTGEAPIGSPEQRVPSLGERPALVENGLLSSEDDLAPPPVPVGPGGRALVAEGEPPVKPSSARPYLLAALPAGVDRLSAKTIATDDVIPAVAVGGQTLKATLVATLPTVKLPSSAIAMDVAATHPTLLAPGSAASLRESPMPALTPEPDVLLASLESDKQPQPAGTAPVGGTLRDDAVRGDVAVVPAPDAEAGRAALADDVVALIAPTPAEETGEPGASSGDAAAAPTAPAEGVTTTAVTEPAEASVPADAASPPAASEPVASELVPGSADVLGGTSYRQASVQAEPPAAKDAMQLLMTEAQSVIDAAAQGQQGPAGAPQTTVAALPPEQSAVSLDPTPSLVPADEAAPGGYLHAGVQVAMTEPTASMTAVAEQAASATPALPDLELGSFQRDQAPLTLAMSEAGMAPDAQPHGEGVRSGSVVLDSVEYDERGEIVIGGAATPNAPLNIYVDNEHVGSAIAGQTGRWTVVPTKPLSEGVHYLRVDQVEAGGKVVARVESPFARVQPIAVSSGDARVIVQPGNSLWRIARRALGGGDRFTAIYQANKSQIADPDLIYPGQVFVVPSPESASTN